MPAVADHWTSLAAVLLVAQSLALAGFGWWSRRFTVAGVGAFQLVVLAMAGRTAAEAAECLFGAQPAVLFWTLGFKCTLSSLLAAGLLLLFADVSGLNRWATPQRRRLLVGATLLLGALAFTNPWTGWVSPDTATAAGWSFGRYRAGPVFLYLIAANAAALLFALGATLYVWREASPLLRKQLGLLLVGYSLPTLAVFIYRAHLLPPNCPNLAPLARIGAIALFAWALSRGQLWRLVPIARSFVLEQHEHGLLVADRNRQVVDANPAACRLLGLPPAATPYGPLAKLLASWPELPALVAHSTHATCEHRPDPARDTYWQLTWTPLRAPGDAAPRGFLLAIADITERKRAETRLREALTARTHEWQRATAAALRAAEEEQARLGHLLHDTLCQDLIACARQAELLRDEVATLAPTAAERLAALGTALGTAGRRAREVSHLLAGPPRRPAPRGNARRPRPPAACESSSSQCALRRLHERHDTARPATRSPRVFCRSPRLLPPDEHAQRADELGGHLFVLEGDGMGVGRRTRILVQRSEGHPRVAGLVRRRDHRAQALALKLALLAVLGRRVLAAHRAFGEQDRGLRMDLPDVGKKPGERGRERRLVDPAGAEVVLPERDHDGIGRVA